MTLQDLAFTARREGAVAGLSQFVASLRRQLGAEDETARTQRAALLAFGIRVVSAGIAYLSQVLLARWMGSFEYGIFVFVWVWVLILGGLSQLGLSMAVIRLVPEYRTLGQTDLLRGLLRGSRWICVGTSTVIMGLGLGVLWLLGENVASYYVLPGYLILFCVPLYTLGHVQDGIGRGFSWIATALLPPYILRPALLLIGMLAAKFAGFPMTAVTAAGAAVVAAWVSVLWQLIALNRNIAETVEPGPRRYEYGLWLKISLPIVLAHAFELVLEHTDLLVLARYLTPTDVAIYFAALKTIGLVSFVHFAVGTAAAHRISALNADGDAEGLARAVRQSVVWTFLPSFLGCVGLLALGWPLLWLFGPEFTAGYPVMFILAAGYLVRAAVGPAEYVLNMLGEQNYCAAVLMGAAALNLTLNFLLIPLWGLMGAGIATAASLVAANMAFYAIARFRLGLNILIWGGAVMPARAKDGE